MPLGSKQNYRGVKIGRKSLDLGQTTNRPPPVESIGAGTMNGQCGTNLDEELCEYALEAQRHPLGSRERQRYLTNLIQGILRSRRVSYPYKNQFLDFYEDIRNEAIQKTAGYICENIHKYNPERSPVIRWFNFFLETRFFPEAIAEVMGQADVILNNYESLEMLLVEKEEPQPLLSEKIKEYVEQDPDGILKNIQHKTFEAVNFRDLLVRRLLGEKWKDISADLGVKISTLSDFYRRSLKEVAPIIKRYLQD